MKIIYIHQYFNTYADGGSLRSYYLAQALVDEGHEVEMITSHNKQHYQKSYIDGITVHYLPVFYANELSFQRRMMAFIWFVFKAYRLASSIKDAKLCYATSTPLTVGVIALLLKQFKKIPFYFEVRDLWPTAPVQMGAIRNPLVIKMAYWLESMIYRKADKIVALSPGMAKEIVEKTTDTRKIHVIPNMADCGFFTMQKKDVLLSARYNAQNKFVITYFGAIGRVNHLEYLIEHARCFQKKALCHVQFLVVGKGSELKKVEALARQYTLTNLLFVPFADKYELREVLSVTDAVYISFDRKPVLETSSPNKFFDSLAAGKLCITNTKGWIKDVIVENGCGFYTDPLKPEDLPEQLLPYLHNERKLAAAQFSARELAENKFSRQKLTRRFVALFRPNVPAVTALKKPVYSA